MNCHVCAYPVTKNEFGRRKKYCSIQCARTAAIRRQYAKRVQERAARLRGKAAQPKPRPWTGARDITAAEIERLFELAKQRQRRQRQRAS